MFPPFLQSNRVHALPSPFCTLAAAQHGERDIAASCTWH